ncbi:MAG: phosphoribosylformylglycinamidine cyclo-ligase, partial [Bdellovibrionota bacterium]
MMMKKEKKNSKKMSYAGAGVNRLAADRFVESIAGLSKATLDRNVVSAVGGYASLYRLGPDRWIAASTDGVGTKLKLAFELGIHDTVGIDLVAMSVNDLLCVGAQPLFFLDYFATGKLDPSTAKKVIKGIVEGCRQASCALVGGETAELPDFYQPGEYDLAGFAVGTLHPRQAIPRIKNVNPGDLCLGLASSGIHSNGFTLVRRLLDGVQDRRRAELARELLTPTRIYVRALSKLLSAGGASGAVKGLAHITGSGFLNVPRISDRVGYDLVLPEATRTPQIYRWIREA